MQDTEHEQEGLNSDPGILGLVSPIRILFIGDVVGRPGRAAIRIILPELIEQYKPHLIIANGENLAGGLGITPETADELFSSGVDILTTGNHVWDKKEILGYIDLDDRILRPANYPPSAPGRGYTIVRTSDDIPVAVVNLSGRVFMDPLDDPFAKVKSIVQEVRRETKIILLDFHAEATSEKMAMGWYLDGQVSAVVGTHTHVQTADERILLQHTAYITDVGMTGPIISVIGTEKELVLRKFLTQMPVRFEVAKGDVEVCAVIIDISSVTGEALSIQRLQKVVRR